MWQVASAKRVLSSGRFTWRRRGRSPRRPTLSAKPSPVPEGEPTEYGGLVRRRRVEFRVWGPTDSRTVLQSAGELACRAFASPPNRTALLSSLSQARAVRPSARHGSCARATRTFLLAVTPRSFRLSVRAPRSSAISRRVRARRPARRSSPPRESRKSRRYLGAASRSVPRRARLW